jgi:hypothetical protein
MSSKNQKLHHGITASVLYFVPLILLVSLGSLQAQSSNEPSIEQVKTSGNYLWGEGFAQEVSDARELARMDLVNRIVVTITANQQLVEQEIDDAYTSAFRSESRSLSRMELRNLGYHDQQRRDGSWRVTAYVSRRDFEETLSANEDRILSKVAQALRIEQGVGINTAIPLYTEAYFSTYFHPAPLYTDSLLTRERALLRSFLQQKISDWMRALRLDVTAIEDRSDADRTELYLNVRVRDANGPVDFVSLAVTRPGYAAHAVMEGRSRIYLDRSFDNRINQLSIEIALQEGMLQDPVLQSLVASSGPKLRRTIEVDISEVLSLDFEARNSGAGLVTLHPVIRNLAVFNLSWSGSRLGRLSDTNPRINLNSLEGPEQITLRVNQNNDLSITRILYPDGRLVPVAERVSEQSTVATDRRTDRRTELPTNRANARAPSQEPTIPARRAENPSGSRGTPPPQEPEAIHANHAVPSAHQSYLQGLMRDRNAQMLTERLGVLAERNILIFGNQSAVRNPSASYVLIVDPETFDILHFLTPPRNNQRLDLYSNETVEDDLARLFRGFGSIWIRFN